VSWRSTAGGHGFACPFFEEYPLGARDIQEIVALSPALILVALTSRRVISVCLSAQSSLTVT